MTLIILVQYVLIMEVIRLHVNILWHRKSQSVGEKNGAGFTINERRIIPCHRSHDLERNGCNGLCMTVFIFNIYTWLNCFSLFVK